MIDVLKQAILDHQVTFLTLVLYASNVGWYLTHRQWGLALYWAAASQITLSATWLLGWKG